MKIPEAAVEAGARAMFAEEQCDRRQKLDLEANWRGRLDDRDRAEYRNLARAAIVAAAPHMLAEASAEVTAAFANTEAAKRALVARAAGVDPETARRLGY